MNWLLNRYRVSNTMNFHPSSFGRSLGLEWELQLLDSETFDLADRIVPLLKTLEDCPLLTPEFIQNTVEIVTSPCADIDALEDDISAALGILLPAAERLDLRLCGAGTHPFGRELAVLTPLPRYLEMEQGMGLGAHTQITFAQHLHVGMDSGEQAVAVSNHLRVYLPVLVALAGNSPLWRGHRTGFTSYRRRILGGARSYGIPPAFADWNDFQRFVQGALDAGIYDGINDIHWDIRPRPQLGTIEIRATDAQSTPAEAIDLAAFTLCLVQAIVDDLDDNGGLNLLATPHPWIQHENLFQAARSGVDANYVNEGMETNHPLRDHVEATLDLLLPVAKRLGLCRRVRSVADRVLDRRGGADRQLRVLELTDSFENVVGALADDLSADPLSKKGAPVLPGEASVVAS